MKPPIALALFALGSFVVNAGCGSAHAAEHTGSVEIQFWNGFSGPDGVTMEHIVEAFNKEHPEIHVKMQIIPWGTYYDKVTLGLAFGGAPDVFVLHASRLPEFASHGSLADLSHLGGQFDSSDFVTKAWNAATYRGTRYAIPLDCHPMGMYYNVDLFRKAGIEHPPTTGEEFIADAHKLTKDTNGDGKPDQWGFAMTDIHLVGSTFLYQFGGRLLNETATQSTLDSPENIAGVKKLMSLSDTEKVSPPPSGNDGWMNFQTGKVGMVFQGIWMIDSLDKQEGLHYAAAPVPFFGPVKTVWANSHCLTMPANQEASHRNAGETFIKYLSDHSILWAQGGQVPVRLSILHSAEFQNLRIQREFAKQLDYVQYEPLAEVINQTAPFADTAVDASLNHVDTPEAEFKDASRRVQNVLRRQ